MITYKEAEVKVRAKIVYFIMYYMMNTWINLISLFMCIHFPYWVFLHTVTRVISTFTMLSTWASFIFLFMMVRRPVWFCIIFTVWVLVYSGVWILLVFPFLETYVMHEPTVYASLTFFWLIIVVLNFILKVRVMYHIFACPHIIFIITFGGTRHIRPGSEFESYSLLTFLLGKYSSRMV